MTRRFVIGALIALLVFAALGGWSARLPAPSVTQTADRWDALVARQAASVSVSEIKGRLKTSGIFAISDTRKLQTLIDAKGGAAPKSDHPPFPKIVASSTVDGVSKVHLLLEDASTFAGVSGDVLPSGWTLKTVDQSRVIAVFGEHEEEFAIGPIEPLSKVASKAKG